jgi:protein O-GlcNAc transferase
VESDDVFAEALEHHRAGRPSRAEALYRAVLTDAPRHDQALFLLGVITLEANRAEEALDYFARAVQVAPDKPAYLSNYGATLGRLGRHQEAKQALWRAARLKPDFAEAFFNLGCVLADHLGEAEEAFLAFERAADLKPDSAPVQQRFARALVARGELARSIGHYQAALALDPSSLPCLLELGAVLRSLGRFEAAIALGRRVVTQYPDSPFAHHLLGLALLDHQQADQALASLRRAIELEPGFADAHSDLGTALGDVGRAGEGLESYRRALELEPERSLTRSNVVYVMPFVPGTGERAVLAEARAWGRRFADPLMPDAPRHDQSRDPERRLRVGYVSPHFSGHCQSFFTTPLFAHHQREEVEVYAYAAVGHPDSFTDMLRSTVDVWRDVSRLSLTEVAEQVRADRIDVLVDLTMHMQKGMLEVFAHRPAPVQICWLAYPGTTGVRAIDYRITDRYLDPPELGDGPYSERSVVLPETFWCYDPLTSEPEPGELPAFANGYVTFGCLNHFRKLNDDVFELWAAVLAEVPDSRLLLLAPPGEPRTRVREVFQRTGVDKSRIIFTDRCSRADYLALYRRIDLGLDSVPYAGHTTSLDAFWMGVPVLTLVGPTVVGRAGLSMAMNLGLRELVTRTAADYVATAQSLAEDVERLAELRRGLRARMQASPLMDAQRFATSLEAAYRAAWRILCAGGSTDRSPISIGARESTPPASREIGPSTPGR